MPPGPTAPLPTLDHLVYAVLDLERTVDELASALGVRPSPGGQHIGRGTHNHLLSFGDGAYLEVIGADPHQPAPEGSRPFGVDELTGPRLVTWAVAVADIDVAVVVARAAGYDPGPAQAMSRATPDGGLLSWRLTPAQVLGDGLVPFLIEWGDTTHPSRTAAGGARLVGFRAEHPDTGPVVAALDALGATALVALEPGPAARLTAEVAGPQGSITLV